MEKNQNRGSNYAKYLVRDSPDELNRKNRRYNMYVIRYIRRNEIEWITYPRNGRTAFFSLTLSEAAHVETFMENTLC